MCKHTHCFIVVTTIVLIGLLFPLVSPKAQSPRFIFSLDSLSVSPGRTQVRMPVYLDHPSDSIAGFQFAFQVDRPGICSLRTTVDTTGCRIGGWPHLTVNRLDSHGYLILVTALYLSLAGEDEPLPPTTDGPPLFYLIFDMFDSPSIFDIGAAVNLRTKPFDYFQMIGPSNGFLGATWVQVPDTTCFQCLQWVGDPPTCVSWEIAPEGPCDSVVVNNDSTLTVDTSQVKIAYQGWVDIAEPSCGDFNLNDQVNLTDVTLLVNYLFGTHSPAPVNPLLVDVANPCLSSLNLTDLTVLVNTLFLDGPPLECCTVLPEEN